MARLYTMGFETQIFSSTPALHGEGDLGSGNTVTSAGTQGHDTSVQRSGSACASFAAGSQNRLDLAITGVLDRTYYYRGYVRFSDATPSAQYQIISPFTTSVPVTVRINTNGTLTLNDSTNAQIGAASAALSDNTWYRVELKIMVPTAGNGQVELRVDGTTVAASTYAVTNIALSALRFGCLTAAGSGTVYFDDVAINDDQGANQNSWPGSGKVILLKPTSQNSIGNWEGPQTTGSDTTGLHDNVDNVPPLGVNHNDADAAAGLYVFNGVSAANNNFDVNVQSYTAAGIGSGDTIQLCQALARMSVNTTTGTNTGAVAGVSNPACTAQTGRNLEQQAVASTEPAGWKSIKSQVAYAPSVTLGTEPVVRCTKEVANANNAMCDLMGLLVEYTPVTATPVDGPVLDLKWDLTGTPSATSTLKWDMVAQVSGPVLDLLFDLRAEANAPARSLLWDTRSQADGIVLDLRWDLGAQVSASSTLKWDLAAAVSAAQQRLLWDLRSEANGIVLDLRWDLAGAVSGIVLDLPWDLRAQADGIILDLKWDLSGAVVQTATLKWDLAAATNGPVLDLLWDLATLGGAVNGDPERLIWDLRSSVAATETLIWDLRAEATAPPERLIWDLWAEASGIKLDLRWDLRSPVSGIVLDLPWDLRAAVNASADRLLWDLRSQMTGSALALLWDLRAARAQLLRLLWDVVGLDDLVALGTNRSAAFTETDTTAMIVGAIAMATDFESPDPSADFVAVAARRAVINEAVRSASFATPEPSADFETPETVTALITDEWPD